MKKFKKLCSLGLTCALLASSCTFVSAERLAEETSSSSHDVKAKYSAGVAADVYAVDIEWGSMEFTYTSAGTQWDPDKHEYVTTDAATWTSTTNDVKITNHSSQPITATLSYTSDTEFSGINGAFTVPSETLVSAVGTDKDDAPSFTSKLELSGDLSADVTELTKIGSATVALSVPEDINNAQSPDDSSQNGSSENEELTLAGYIRFVPKVDEYITDTREVEIYMQSPNVYIAEICLDKVLTDVSNPDTEIVIDGVPYYIQLEGKGAKFEPGTSVGINTSPIDTAGDKPLRKETVVEAGKTYELLIILTGDGSGNASLTEITN